MNPKTQQSEALEQIKTLLSKVKEDDCPELVISGNFFELQWDSIQMTVYSAADAIEALKAMVILEKIKNKNYSLANEKDLA